MSFDDLVKSDAPAFLATFGESIAVYPPVGAARQIRAIVTRGPVAQTSPQTLGIAPKMLIEVANDSTIGIASSEQPWIGWYAELANDIGGDVKKFQIFRPDGEFSQDAGMLMLALR